MFRKEYKFCPIVGARLDNEQINRADNIPFSTRELEVITPYGEYWLVIEPINIMSFRVLSVRRK